MASAFIYQINDMVDIEKDRNHPRKKNRPIASGEVSFRQAILLSIFLLFSASLLSFYISIKAFLIISCYLAIQTLYCFFLKNKEIIELYIIASRIVLRSLSAVLIIDSKPSHWFLITSGFMALFLAIVKRKSELKRKIIKDIKNDKLVLDNYTVEYLEKFELFSVISGFLSYVFWASGPILNGANSSLMLLTCPLLLLGINRYQLISDIRLKSENFKGESPTEILFSDKFIKFIIILWLFTSFLISNADF